MSHLTGLLLELFGPAGGLHDALQLVILLPVPYISVSLDRLSLGPTRI